MFESIKRTHRRLLNVIRFARTVHQPMYDLEVTFGALFVLCFFHRHREQTTKKQIDRRT